MKRFVFALAISAVVLSGCGKPYAPGQDDNQQQQNNGGEENNGGENGGENGNGNSGDGASFYVESAGKMIQIGDGDAGFSILRVECSGVTPTVDSSDPSWLTATISTTELRIDVTRNDSGADRRGRLTITPGELEKVTIDVLQPEYVQPELYSITATVAGNDMGLVIEPGSRSGEGFFGFWKEGSTIHRIQFYHEDNQEGVMSFYITVGDSPLEDGITVYMVYARGITEVDDDGSFRADFTSQVNGPQTILTGSGTVRDRELAITLRHQCVLVNADKFSGFAHGESITTLKAAGDKVVTDATFVPEGDGFKAVPGSEHGIIRFCYEESFTGDGISGKSFAILPGEASRINISAIPLNSNYMYEYVIDEAEPGGKAGKTIGLGIAEMKEAGVRLYSGSPFWKYCNAGASVPEEFGGWYSWGNVDSHDDLDYWWGKEYGEPLYANYTSTPGNSLTGTYAARSEYDAAYIACGGTWETPTKDDLDCLRRYCNITYGGEGSGVTFSGKGDYAGGSIFVPYAESGAKGGKVINASLNCYLWSRTFSKEQYGFKTAWCLWLSRYAPEDSGNWSLEEDAVQSGFSVRPVSR